MGMSATQVAERDELREKLTDLSADWEDSHTLPQLRQMVEFFSDNDPDDDEPASGPETEADGSTPGAEAEPADGLDILADLEEELAEDEMPDDLAELMGGSYEDAPDAEDLGEGDLDGPHVEISVNYHGLPLHPENRTDPETDVVTVGFMAIIAPSLRLAVTTARDQGRRPTSMPIIAHRWPATGTDREELIIQVPVRPVRGDARDRRRRRPRRR